MMIYHCHNSVPFLANVPFLYPMKTSENMWFSGGKKKETLATNELIENIKKGWQKMHMGQSIQE